MISESQFTHMWNGNNNTSVVKIQRREWHPTAVLLPGQSHGWGSLVGCSPWVAKSWTRLSNFTFTFHFRALEKEMATHSSALAWRIPGTGEPGGLPSMGSHRVEHNWSDLAVAAVKIIVLKIKWDAALKRPQQYLAHFSYSGNGNSLCWQQW